MTAALIEVSGGVTRAAQIADDASRKADDTACSRSTPRSRPPLRVKRVAASRSSVEHSSENLASAASASNESVTQFRVAA